MLSNENAAEKLFAEMSQRDGSTYGALIQGLVKVSNISEGVWVLFL